MNQQPLKILYIAGYGRSGSTILDRTLGQAEGFVSLGEFGTIPDMGLRENRLCGCGEPFRDCPFWREAFDRAFGGMEGQDGQELFRRRFRYTRTSQMMLMALGLGRWKSDPQAVEVARWFGRLYRAVADMTGARVLIDSTKAPSIAQLVALDPEVEVRVLHLVRDLRAVAHSNQKAKRKYGERSEHMMETRNPAFTALFYAIRNLTTEAIGQRIGHYRFVRYEDWVAHPRDWTRRIMDFAGEPDVEVPIEGERTVPMKPAHTAAGNPSRFDTGDVVLRLDDAWRERIQPVTRVTASLLGWPVLQRYGYLSPDK